MTLVLAKDIFIAYAPLVDQNVFKPVSNVIQDIIILVSCFREIF